MCFEILTFYFGHNLVSLTNEIRAGDFLKLSASELKHTQINIKKARNKYDAESKIQYSMHGENWIKDPQLSSAMIIEANKRLLKEMNEVGRED